MEEWMPVLGFEGLYEASTLGRVRSLDRIDTAGRRIRGRVLSPGRLPSGRLQVTLCKDGVAHQLKVHQVVARAFHGLCPDGMEVRHYPDRDVANNRPENLRYGTKHENFLDSVEHGTHKELRKTHCPRKHPLEMPNLRSRQGDWRECLACSEAYMILRSQNHLDLQEVADACYEEIVNGTTNPYRRTKSQAHKARVEAGLHYQAAKTRCLLNHLLQEPNLDSYMLKRGYRKCLSCDKARNQTRYNGGDKKELADKFYRSLGIADPLLNR